MTIPARAALPGRPAGQRVRVVALQVESLEDGRLRVSSPHARGWAATARTPVELARAVQDAYTEVACASYALARGQAYDLDQLTTHVPGDRLADAPQRRARGAARTTRRKAYAPESWTRMDDGRWRSPSGRAYRQDSTVVGNVIRRRQEKGLPT